MKQKEEARTGFDFEKVVDLIIRLGVLSVLLFWCFNILRPFLSIIIGGMVISIAVYPVYSFLLRIFGGRKSIALLILLLIMLGIIILPTLLITESLIDGVKYVREVYDQGKPLIPPPGEAVKNWPVVTKPIVDLWSLASENILKVTTQYKEQLEAAAGWLFTAITGVGKSVLVFIGSAIAGIFFLGFSERLSVAMLQIFNKIAGSNGELFASISV